MSRARALIARRAFGVVLIAYALCASFHTRAADRVARLTMVQVAEPGVLVRGYDGFWKRLEELGWARGKTLDAEELFARGRTELLPELIQQAVSRKSDVIVTGSTPGALAAKQATSTIPIVIMSMGDPVGAGVVTNLAHPGGNITGMSIQATDGLPGKWLELMREALPRVSSIAVVRNPANPLGEIQWRQLQEAAGALRIKITSVPVATNADLAPAFQRIHAERHAALVLTDPLTVHHRRTIAALAAKHRVPAMYTMLEFADDGGLLAHGVDHAPLARRAAEYVDRILRGAKPGDLPIEQPGSFKVVINLKAARALGIEIPDSLRQRADEVIR